MTWDLTPKLTHSLQEDDNCLMQRGQQIKTSPTHHSYRETISQDIWGSPFLQHLRDSLVSESKPNVNRAHDFREPWHAWWQVDRKPIKCQTVNAHTRKKLKPDQSSSVHINRRPLKEQAWRGRLDYNKNFASSRPPAPFAHTLSHHLPRGTCNHVPHSPIIRRCLSPLLSSCNNSLWRKP